MPYTSGTEDAVGLDVVGDSEVGLPVGDFVHNIFQKCCFQKNYKTETGSKGGRTPYPFEKKGKTARHNAITNVVKAAKNSMACAALATKRLASEAGFDDAAWVFKKLAKDPVGFGKAITEALKRPEGPIVMSAEEGWAHMVLARLSKGQYKTIFKRQRRNIGKIYPDYDIMKEAKSNWMPNKANFQATSLYISPR